MESGNSFCRWNWSSLRRPSAGILLLILIVISIYQFQPSGIFFFPPPVSDGAAGGAARKSCSGFYQPTRPRELVKSITDFGGIGDGSTSNTAAFRKAIDYLSRHRGDGGSQLNVPKGKWITGSFNLTSHFTLFLEEEGVILGSQDMSEWPLIQALPSYGRGRERPGGRHISLIHGDGLEDIVITGNNGSIDGQGRMWWEMWWNRTLEHTRGHVVELMNSHNILISNLTFLNSPFWTIHPVYCRNVVIKGVSVLAPLHSPNTDGIDPDSSSNVCIEDCYIESGDDLVAIKSGWDQYGLSTARPSSNIIVRRVSGTTPTCSGVGIGSEMSGGVTNVIIDDLNVWDSAVGIRIKTDKGRGGYITNISISNIHLERVKVPIRFSTGANDHPDEMWDPKALPVMMGIFIGNVFGSRIERAPVLEGIKDAHFFGICMRNITLEGIPSPAKWKCDYVSGYAVEVSPFPCSQLQIINVSSSLCRP